MGLVLFVVVLVAALAWWIFAQIQARQQVDVESHVNAQQADEIVRKYFGFGWERVNGPGRHNFRARFRKWPPTMSINVASRPDGCVVQIWLSAWEPAPFLINHATLAWRKQRGLAKRVVAPATQVSGGGPTSSPIVNR